MGRKRKSFDTPGKDEARPRSAAVLIAVVWIGFLLLHATKSLQFYPLVIPDEYWYTSDLRHRPFSGTVYPGHLYYLVYSVTNLFGHRFLDAARVVNALLFCLSAPFIHGVARLVCGKRTALFLTALALASPLSSYTAYFMPESMYFTAFWAFAWLVLKHDSLSPARAGAAAGAGIAILSLIKMHGVFLLPGYILFTVAATPRGPGAAFWKRTATAVAATAAAFAVVRLGLGAAFAGANGLYPLGAYRDFTGGGETAFDPAFLIREGAYSMAGHVMAVIVLFAPVLALAAQYLARSGRPETGVTSAPRRVLLFAICFLAPLIAVSAGYAGMLITFLPDMDVPESMNINARYYNFLYPAFFIAAAGLLRDAVPKTGRADGIARAALLVSSAVCVYVALTYFHGYIVLPIPANPELGGLASAPFLFLSGVLLLGAVYAAMAFRPFAAGRAYLYVLAPALFVAATVCTHVESIFACGIFPDIYDKGGIHARDSLGDECADLTVVDGFVYSMTKALIHIDNAKTDMLPQFDGEVDVGLIKPGKKWLLVFGGLEVPKRHVESEFLYDDPSLTPELVELMRQRNDFRAMPRFRLVRLKTPE